MTGRGDGARPTDEIHQGITTATGSAKTGRCAYSASISTLGQQVISLQTSDTTPGNWRRTLLHKLGAIDPPLDLGLVPHLAVRHEGPVQARAEVGEAEGVLAAEEEELCVRSARVRGMMLRA